MIRRILLAFGLVCISDAERIQHEQVELLIKAARRCTHDLEHASQDVWWCGDEAQRSGQSQMWARQAKMWQDIFYPDNGMKDYRTRLHGEISAQSITIRLLCKRLKERGIDFDDISGTPDSFF